MNGLRRNYRKVKQPKKLTRDLKLAVAAYGLYAGTMDVAKRRRCICDDYSQVNWQDKNY